MRSTTGVVDDRVNIVRLNLNSGFVDTNLRRYLFILPENLYNPCGGITNLTLSSPPSPHLTPNLGPQKFTGISLVLLIKSS